MLQLSNLYKLSNSFIEVFFCLLTLHSKTLLNTNKYINNMLGYKQNDTLFTIAPILFIDIS